MIRTFTLPVTETAALSVIYQKPDSDTARSAAASRKTKKSAKAGGAGAHDLSLPPPRKPLIIMMHGFPGTHKAGCDDIFGELEYRFEGWGFPSVRFDFRGSGESDGVPADFCLDSALEDLNAVLQWAQHDAGHRSFILAGEGFGATIAALAFQPRIMHGLMMFWPILKPREAPFGELFTRDARVQSMEADAPFVPFRKVRLSAHFLNDLYQMDLTRTLENIKAPTLIQYGTEDDEVPVTHIHFARDTLGGPVDLAIYEGGGHGLRAMNMRQAMFVNIRLFLDRILKKLDSAAKN